MMMMPRKFWYGEFFCHLPFFGQNWEFWEFLTYNFQMPLWIFLIFGMEVVLMVLFEKIILYMPGKFWYGENLAIGQNLAIFWPKLRVLRDFDLLLPNAAMNLSNFWYESFSNGLSWENYTLYAWKILIWQKFWSF